MRLALVGTGTASATALMMDEDASGPAVTSKAGYVTPEDFGAVGDGSDDSNAVIALLAYATANEGTSIYMAAGKTYGIASTAFVIPSNTHVWGFGTLKCLQDAPGGRGIIVIPADGAHDIIWDGPTIDGNFTKNANCIGAGAQNANYAFHENIYINCTVKNARTDLDLAASSANGAGLTFGGGGKGYSIQGRCRNIYARITAINCDIGATIEAGTTNERWMPNCQLDLISDNSLRTHLYLIGSTPLGYGTTASASFEHGHMPGCKVNMIAYGGNTEAFVDFTDNNTVKPNHEVFGVITSTMATGVEINAHVAVQAKATLLRGKMFGSKINITAYMDDLQDVWDARVITAEGKIGTNLLDNVLEVDVHAKTHHGVLITSPATGKISRSNIAIDTWVENGVGNIMAPGGDDFGASVVYRFRDLKASPVKEIVGNSETAAAPDWPLADEGGRVAVERESFPYLAYDEVPIVLGSGGTSRRWLHWDNTNSVLRLSASSPRTETAGGMILTRTTETVTTAVTLGAAGDYVVFVDAGGVPTLPTAVGNTSSYRVKNVSSDDQSLATTGAETIDGMATLTLGPGQAAEIVSDGANWRIF